MVILTGLALGLFFVFQKPEVTNAQVPTIIGTPDVGQVLTGVYTYTQNPWIPVGIPFTPGSNYTSLALDHNDVPYVSYVASSDPNFLLKTRVMKNDNGT